MRTSSPSHNSLPPSAKRHFHFSVPESDISDSLAVRDFYQSRLRNQPDSPKAPTPEPISPILKQSVCGSKTYMYD